jgi:hypothetical protein
MGTERDERLLAAFVTLIPEDEPDQSFAVQRWETPVEALDELRTALGVRLPALYERLVLSYRWPEADLGPFTLLAHPPGEGLAGLLDEIRRDPAFCEELIPLGLIPFGRGPGGWYDPVCFDTRRRRSGGDCRVVRLDHEEVLCNSRLREVAELAPTFRRLLEDLVREEVSRE